LARKAARFATDSFGALVRADPDVPKELYNRDADNWRVLLAIADVAGGTWPVRARQAALEISGVVGEGKRKIQDVALLLLGDLREMFIAWKTDKLKSAVIVRVLAKMENRPWPVCDKGNVINPSWVAEKLRDFDIEPKVIRFDNTPKGLGRGYGTGQFRDAWERYLGPRNGPEPGPEFLLEDAEEPNIPDLLDGRG
jgi:putative DNA primase/helicase